MTFYGADVSQLRELAKAVDKAATLLSSRAGSLQGQIQSAPWKGMDGAQFRQDWTGSHRPALERVAQASAITPSCFSSTPTSRKRPPTRPAAAGAASWTRSGASAAAPNWLEQQMQAIAAAKAHRQELEQGLSDMLKASPEEQATWWDGLSEADRQYLIEG